MKALLLAAGRGTRLGPLTANQPKPMIPIGGVPMIERIMSGIAAHTPVREFVLITGYKADVLQGYLGDGSRWGWHIQYVPQPVPRGVGDAVHTAREALADAPFLMTYGDIMLDPMNYARFAQEYDAHGTDRIKAYVGLNWVEDPWAGAAVYLDPDNIIQRIQEKPPRGTAATHWNNAGLFIFDPLIFTYTAQIAPSARGEYELPDAITAMITAGHPAKGIALEGNWRDVGTPEDYAAINAEYEGAQNAG
jgi:NDP-sugar pyrophosphorylase family protein